MLRVRLSQLLVFKAVMLLVKHAVNMKGCPLQKELAMSKTTYDRADKYRLSFSGADRWISAADENESTNMSSKPLVPLNRACATKRAEDRVPPQTRKV